MYGEDYNTALKFANEVFKEFSSVIKSIIYFGSGSRKSKKPGDIDVLIIFNDANVISDLDFKVYFQKRINDAINKISSRLHVNIVTMTVFFENLINGEPVVMNVLRDGIELIDTGFFAPLKILLLRGKIRPSAEAILNSATRVEAHITKSKVNILAAFQELYLSMLDAAQATIMAYGLVAPSPVKVPNMLKSIKIESKHIEMFKKMYKIFKKIEHRELNKMSGKQYDEYYEIAKKFNKEMEKKLKKKL